MNKLLVLLILAVSCGTTGILPTSNKQASSKLSNIKVKAVDQVHLVGPMVWSFPMIVLATQLDQISEDQDAHENAHRTILVRINSPGGSVTVLEELEVQFTKLKLKNVTVNCLIDGVAASAAFMILSSCDSRYAFVDTQLLFHPPAAFISEYSGRAGDLKELADELTETDRQIYEKLLLVLPKDIVDRFYPLNIFWSAQHFVKITLDPNWLVLVSDVEVVE